MTPNGMDAVLLNGEAPAGWLAPRYERSYRRMATHRIDGEPAIVLGPLRCGLTEEIPLPHGPLVRFTCYPGGEGSAPGQPGSGGTAEPVYDPGALFDVQENGHTLRVVARRIPYAPFQGLLVPLEHQPQQADAGSLRVAFAYLRALGAAYTGTFNVGGRTHDRFHAQFFRGSAPLWDHVSSGTVGPEPSRHARVSRGVWRADVTGWPCRCSLFGSTDPSLVASAVAARTSDLRRRAITYDLCFRWDGEELRVLLFPRASSADDELHLYPPDRLELGKFGALELAGWVLSIRDQDVFRRLVAHPEALARRYDHALARIGPGWMPADARR